MIMNKQEIEKAINILKDIKRFEIPYGRLWKMCEVSISALEKQIPKKPEWTPAYRSYFSAGDEAEPLCHGCGELLEDDQPICLDCYQVIDWSVEE